MSQWQTLCRLLQAELECGGIVNTAQWGSTYRWLRRGRSLPAALSAVFVLATAPSEACLSHQLWDVTPRSAPDEVTDTDTSSETQGRVLHAAFCVGDKPNLFSRFTRIASPVIVWIAISLKDLSIPFFFFENIDNGR